MVLELKFDSISELAELQRLAVQADKPVYIANEDDSIRVDARSFWGFSLDYSKPLKVITDSSTPCGCWRSSSATVRPTWPTPEGDTSKKSGRARPFRSFTFYRCVHEFPIISGMLCHKLFYCEVLV